MKVFSIFIKNLKTVARNWMYFLVLFILPLFLIVAAALVLGSNDLKNVRIGVVSGEDDYLLQEYGLVDFGRVTHYSSMHQCLYYLTNGRVGVCTQSYKNVDSTYVEVYVDNTQRTVELYVKQALLERVFEEQTASIQSSTQMIDSKLSIYTSSIDDALFELENVENELMEQEALLVGYRENVSLARQDFDEVYWEIKRIEPELQNLKEDVLFFDSLLGDTTSDMGVSISNLRSDIDELRIFLGGVLDPGDYDYASSLLNEIDQDLNNIESEYQSLRLAYPGDEIVEVLEAIEDLIVELDKFRDSLINLENDLDVAIERTRESYERVSDFRYKLVNAKHDLNAVGDETSKGSIDLVFRDSFEGVSRDLVLLSFPFVIAMILTFSSLVLSNKFVLNQVNKPSYLKEIIAPTRDVNFIFADYFINLFFMAIQVAVLLLIGILWFGISTDKLPALLTVIFLATSTLILIGMAFGYLIKSESLSVLLTIFFVMFLLIFSDILVPAILSTTLIRFLTGLNPFMILKDAIWQIMIIDKPLWQLAQPISRFVIMFFSSFLIAYFAKKASKEGVVQ